MDFLSKSGFKSSFFTLSKASKPPQNAENPELSDKKTTSLVKYFGSNPSV